MYIYMYMLIIRRTCYISLYIYIYSMMLLLARNARKRLERARFAMSSLAAITSAVQKHPGYQMLK